MVIISKKIKSFYTPVQYLSTDLFYYDFALLFS